MIEPVVINVLHRGQPKMTGKVLLGVLEEVFGPEHAGPPVFYHQEVVQSQQHTKLNSPGGVDLCVLLYLLEHEVTTFLHESDGVIWSAAVGDIIVLGDYETWDERERVFLPWRYWCAHGPRTFRVPWIDAEVTLS